MYLADLGLCGSSRKTKTLSVGWLDMAHEFPKGPVPEGFLDRLIELIKKPVGMNMGGHACQFCPAHVFADRTKWPYQAPRGANGEIQVQGKEGLSYSAPTMIAHYVEAHGYAPPLEFIEAVMMIKLPMREAPKKRLPWWRLW